MSVLRRADAAAPARRIASARVAVAPVREYPRRVQALEAQFAGFAGQMTEFGGRLSSLEGRMGHFEQRLDRVEQRLDRVEALLEQLTVEVKQLAGDVKRLTIDVAEIKGRLSQIPTSFQLVSWVLSLNFGLTIGMSGLIYAIVRATLAH